MATNPKIGKRREGRQAAMQFLFAHDLHGKVSDAERSAFWDLHMAKTNARSFAEEMVNGNLDHRVEVDSLIASVS